MSTDIDLVRRKRLIALGELQECNVGNSNSAVDKEDTQIPREPAKGRKTKLTEKSAQAVIDLCNTSDEESRTLQPARKKRVTESAVASCKGGANTDSTTLRSIQVLQSGQTPLAFQVASWNVWFGPPNDANPHVTPRMRELVRLAVHGKRGQKEPYQAPWFIGLQEVTQESAIPLAESLKRAGYSTIITQEFEGGARMPYFCQLAVRHGSSNDPKLLESGSVGYTSTRMGRGFCYARVRLPGGNTHLSQEEQPQLLVATTHLESWAGKEYSGSIQRQEQLLEFENNCRSEFKLHAQLKWVILMGDLNWDDERKKGSPDSKMSAFLTLPWKDVWLDHLPSQQDESTHFTYDGKLNPMLGNNMRRRFDRCLVFARDHASLNQLASQGVQLLGQQTLPGLRFSKSNPWSNSKREYPVAPSDHFGLIARLSFH